MMPTTEPRMSLGLPKEPTEQIEGHPKHWLLDGQHQAGIL